MDILDISVEGFEKSIDNVLDMDQGSPEISKTKNEVPEDQPGLLTEESESEESLTNSDKIWQLPCNGEFNLYKMIRKCLLFSFIALFPFNVFRFCF